MQNPAENSNFDETVSEESGSFLEHTSQPWTFSIITGRTSLSVMRYTDRHQLKFRKQLFKAQLWGKFISPATIPCFIMHDSDKGLKNKFYRALKLLRFHSPFKKL